MISDEAMEILLILTPEWMGIDNYNYLVMPPVRELLRLGLIELKWIGGKTHIKITPRASQFVLNMFN